MIVVVGAFLSSISLVTLDCPSDFPMIVTLLNSMLTGDRPEICTERENDQNRKTFILVMTYFLSLIHI